MLVCKVCFFASSVSGAAWLAHAALCTQEHEPADVQCDTVVCMYTLDREQTAS